MSQAPEGDVYLVIQDDTIIVGVYTNFKNAGRLAGQLQDAHNKSVFRVRPYRINSNLIGPLEKMVNK